MLLFDRNNETRIVFEPKQIFSEIYLQFRFWGQNLFFQLLARTFFRLSITSSKNDRF